MDMYFLHDLVQLSDWSSWQEWKGHAQGRGCGTQCPWRLTPRSDQ